MRKEDISVTETITSIKDPRVAEARELISAQGRSAKHKCLLEGIESIQWALEARMPVEHVFYYAATRAGGLLHLLREKHISCYAVSDGILKKISDTAYLVPFIGVAQLPPAHSIQDEMSDLVLLLDCVQDHGNIGTIIRTACAFGVRDIISTRTDVDMYYKKIIAASRGKVFEMNVCNVAGGVEAIHALKHKGYQIVATSSHASTIQALAPLQAEPVALVVGNETEGVSDEVLQLADAVVQIPMSGAVESLNVGVATGVSLYELKFRMVLSMLIRYIRSNFGREVNVTGKMIMMAFDAQIRHVSDLNGLQVLLLMILKCDQVMTMQQIARDMGMFGSELDELLAPLLNKNYISYSRKHDQLASERTIQLTSEGERVLAHLWNIVERAEAQVLAGFSESEKKQLDEFLKRIQANCEAMLGE